MGNNNHSNNQNQKPQGATKFTQPIYDEQDENDIDVVLKKELAEKGLEYRFIDFKKARENGGRSNRGWVMYRRDSKDPTLQGIEALADPDGLVRRGSLVLAVKTKQGAERQRASINMQNKLSSGYNEQVANELGNQARQIGSQVITGYERNS